MYSRAGRKGFKACLSFCNYVQGAEVLLRKWYLHIDTGTPCVLRNANVTSVFTRFHHWPPIWATL